MVGALEQIFDLRVAVGAIRDLVEVVPEGNGVGHREGSENVFLEECGEREVRDFLDDLGEEGVTGVAVFELAAWIEFSFGLLSEQVENVSV